MCLNTAEVYLGELEVDDLEEKVKVRKRLPSCRFNSGVWCKLDGRICYRCGWNTDVSIERIRKKYGREYTIWLSEPEKRG